MKIELCRRCRYYMPPTATSEYEQWCSKVVLDKAAKDFASLLKTKITEHILDRADFEYPEGCPYILEHKLES